MNPVERKYKVKFLLLGFNMELNYLELEDNLIIRKGDDGELQEMYERIKQNNAQSQRFFVEYEYKSKDTSTFSKEGYALMDDLNTFFQIFYNGIVKAAHFSRYGWIDNKYQSIGFSTNTRVSTYFPEGYIFENKEVKSIKEKWCSYRVQTKNKALKIATNRFLLSTQKYDNEDQLIDLMIAFEAIFLDVSEKGELSYKLALRSSYLLKNDFRSLDVFDFMKKAYNLRSSIVHGANFKGNEIKFKEKKLDSKSVVSTLTDLFRVSVQIILIEREETEIQHLIKAIDSEIVEGFK